MKLVKDLDEALRRAEVAERLVAALQADMDFQRPFFDDAERRLRAFAGGEDVPLDEMLDAVEKRVSHLDAEQRRSEERGARWALDACYEAMMRDHTPPIAMDADQRVRDALQICAEARNGGR